MPMVAALAPVAFAFVHCAPTGALLAYSRLRVTMTYAGFAAVLFCTSWLEITVIARNARAKSPTTRSSGPIGVNAATMRSRKNATITATNSMLSASARPLPAPDPQKSVVKNARARPDRAVLLVETAAG